MDEVKLILLKIWWCVLLLLDGIREMSYFFVKLRCSLFDIKLWKYLLVDVGRRYSIYVLYIVFLL